MRFRVTRSNDTTAEVVANHVTTRSPRSCVISIGESAQELVFYNTEVGGPYSGLIPEDIVRVFAAGQWSDYEILGD